MNFAILGAGPSGLTASRLLKHPNTVFEKDNHPGGHTSSISDQGYTFDQGPHIMFSKNKPILDFMVKSLKKNVHKCRRNNKVSYKGRLIKWPFENDLASLPARDTLSCLKSYINNPYKKRYPKPKNLRQWLLYHFGEGMCYRFLFPYNEKVWNVPVEQLSMIWADRIPKPSTDDILKSALGHKTEGYLHQLYYHYPLTGGYQALSQAWAKNVNVHYNFEVKNISKTKKGAFIVSDGIVQTEFDQIISTIPIHELVKILSFPIPQNILRAVKNLMVNPMIVISLGIKGKDNNQYTAIYFPEDDFLVNRISFPKTFSPNNAPKGYYSIQAEITCKKNSPIWKRDDAFFMDHVIDGLIKRKIFRKKSLICYQHVLRVPYAYVVYDKAYEKNVRKVRKWFPQQGIHLLGRFSYFEYINTDGAIDRAQKVIGALNGKHEKAS